MKLRLFILTLLSSVALRAADLPVFNAILAVGKESRFVLVSPAGKSSSWLKLGDTFEGYQLKAYDAKTSGLDLEREGKVTRVTLVADAAVANGTSGPAAVGASTPATVADAEAMLKVMRFDEMMKKIAEGQQKAMGPMFKQMTSRMEASGADAEKIQAFQKKITDTMLAVMTDPETQSAMAKAYADSFTKEELNGLATFYSTPIGQSLIEKQPEVSAKLNESLMPRMMKAMQSVQQSGMQDFGRGGAAPAPAPAPAPKP